MVNTLKSDDGPPPETVSNDVPGPVILVTAVVLLSDSEAPPSKIVRFRLKTVESN
jgi:hypothetical protein